MLSHYRRQKLLHLFNLYDVNQDGLVGKQDFDLAAAGLVEQLGYGPGSSESEGIALSYGDYWAYLRRYMDRDHDEYVSSSEFVDRFDLMLRQPESQQVLIITVSDYLLQLMDVDGNGIINQKEYEAYLGAHYLSPQEARSAFEEMDRNISGTITRAELLDGVANFFCSDDPTLPGNGMFGKVGD